MLTKNVQRRCVDLIAIIKYTRLYLRIKISTSANVSKLIEYIHILDLQIRPILLIVSYLILGLVERTSYANSYTSTMRGLFYVTIRSENICVIDYSVFLL